MSLELITLIILVLFLAAWTKGNIELSKRLTQNEEKLERIQVLLSDLLRKNNVDPTSLL